MTSDLYFLAKVKVGLRIAIARTPALDSPTMQSNSATIFRASKANKHGLAKMLDSTLRNNHDLRVRLLVPIPSCQSYHLGLGDHGHTLGSTHWRAHTGEHT